MINTFNDKPATLSWAQASCRPPWKRCRVCQSTRTSFELAAGEALAMQCRHAAMGGPQAAQRTGRPDEKYNVGDVVQFPTPDGSGSYAGAVQQVRDDGAVLFDFNHPLAGRPVTFEAHVIVSCDGAHSRILLAARPGAFAPGWTARSRLSSAIQKFGAHLRAP